MKGRGPQLVAQFHRYNSGKVHEHLWTNSIMFRRRYLPRLSRKKVILWCVAGALLFLMYQLIFFMALNNEASQSSRVHSRDFKTKNELAIISKNKNYSPEVLLKQSSLPQNNIQQTKENKYGKDFNIRSDIKERNSDKKRFLSKTDMLKVSDNLKAQKSDNSGKSSDIYYISKGEPASVKQNIKQSKFVCKSTGEVIEVSKVNDDYCDCPEDGSDEPLTSACENSHFQCTGTRQGYPGVLPSSSVNDGICDCCDGTDEWAGHVLSVTLSQYRQDILTVHQAPCPDLCAI